MRVNGFWLVVTWALLAELGQAETPNAEPPLVEIQPGTVVRTASVTEGVKTLTQRDEFIKSLSPFDRQARLQVGEAVSEARFLEFVADQVLAWDTNEKQRLAEVMQTIAKELAPYAVPLPPRILLVKTTGKEEGEAAYCRGRAIVLPRRMIEDPNFDIKRLLTHELFHLISRHDPQARDSLYAIIGFRPCPDVQLPNSIRDRHITNPDGAVIQHCLEVTHDGKPIHVAPVLISRTREYAVDQGGSFFRYLQFRLLPIDPNTGRWNGEQDFSESSLLTAADVPDYMNKIGNNTNYIIHPDEILADNFVHMVHNTENLRTPRIVNEMRAYFQRKSP